MLSSALLILALTGTPATPAAWEDPGREWCDGPARYLLTRSESRRYRRLASRSGRVLILMGEPGGGMIEGRGEAR